MTSNLSSPNEILAVPIFGSTEDLHYSEADYNAKISSFIFSALSNRKETLESISIRQEYPIFENESMIEKMKKVGRPYSVDLAIKCRKEGRQLRLLHESKIGEDPNVETQLKFYIICYAYVIYSKNRNTLETFDILGSYSEGTTFNLLPYRVSNKSNESERCANIVYDYIDKSIKTTLGEDFENFSKKHYVLSSKKDTFELKDEGDRKKLTEQLLNLLGPTGKKLTEQLLNLPVPTGDNPPDIGKLSMNDKV